MWTLSTIMRRLLPSWRKAPTLTLRLSVIVEPDEGRFHAYAPALKGLHADGDSEEDALRNLTDALPAYVESLSKHGDALPIGPECTVHMQAEPIPPIPAGAFLRHVMLQWPSLETSGIS